MVKEYIKEHLIQIISLVPVVFIATGTFILNIYLYQYGIMDILLFDSKTIFSGFIFCFQIIIFSLYWFSLTKIAGNKVIEIFKLFINGIFKPIVFVFFMCSLIGIKYNYPSFLPKKVFEIGLVGMILAPLIFFMKTDIDNFKSDSFFGRFSTFFFISLVIVSSIIFFIIALYNKNILNLIKCYCYFSLCFLVLSFSTWNIKSSLLIGNDIKYTSLYTTENKVTNLDLSFSTFLLLLSLMVCLTFYAKNVFPYIPSNLGGGHYKNQNITLANEKEVKGKIIYNNKDYIYILENDELSQYPIESIRKYKTVNESNVNGPEHGAMPKAAPEGADRKG